MSIHITIALDNPQEPIATILSNCGFEQHHIAFVDHNPDITISVTPQGLVIEKDNVINFPFLIKDFVQSVRSAYYNRYIHTLSVARDVFHFDAINSTLSTEDGTITLTLREIFFLMPLFKEGYLKKEPDDTPEMLKQIREKLGRINLVLILEPNDTYFIKKKNG